MCVYVEYPKYFLVVYTYIQVFVLTRPPSNYKHLVVLIRLFTFLGFLSFTSIYIIIHTPMIPQIQRHFFSIKKVELIRQQPAHINSQNNTVEKNDRIDCSFDVDGHKPASVHIGPLTLAVLLLESFNYVCTSNEDALIKMYVSGFELLLRYFSKGRYFEVPISH